MYEQKRDRKNIRKISKETAGQAGTMLHKFACLYREEAADLCVTTVLSRTPVVAGCWCTRDVSHITMKDYKWPEALVTSWSPS